MILVSSTELLTQARKCIRALTHKYIYDYFGRYVCYCTYKSTRIAFNDDPSRNIYCDKHIRQLSASDEIAFECTLIPVTAATEIHRSERKAGFIEIKNRSF